MKLKRKELNKVEKLARKELIKEMIIIYSIMFLALFLLFLDIMIPTRFRFFCCSHEDRIFFILIVLLFLLFAIVFWFIRKPEYMKYAYKKINEDDSKKLVEENLVPLTPTKIAIINTRDGMYKDFILQLPDTETYAILGVNFNEISIYVKFIKSNKDILLDIITKKEFTTYCKILDDNSKE